MAQHTYLTFGHAKCCHNVARPLYDVSQKYGKKVIQINSFDDLFGTKKLTRINEPIKLLVLVSGMLFANNFSISISYDMTQNKQTHTKHTRSDKHSVPEKRFLDILTQSNRNKKTR